jgi:hypothetical protein
MLAFSGVGDLEDLALLRKEPIVSWCCLDVKDYGSSEV